MGNSQDGTGYGCSLPAMVKSWRSVWRAPENALFGVATLAAGGSEGAGQHMGGMRWSQTANYGSWPNPAMPHSFGAQVYDLGDPWSHLGDGNPRMTNQTTGNVVVPEVLKCCFSPQPNASGQTTPNGCPNSTSKDPSMHKSCPDPLNCSLPDPSTGKYGSSCLPWADLTWGAKLKPFAPLIRANSPSGVPGVNFMGGIHPRLKRPVGYRLAHAAAMQLKQQELGAKSGGGGGGSSTAASGAITGPTISGCAHAAGTDAVTLTFNASLLGGEGLLLRPFDANETGCWLGETNPRTQEKTQGTQDSSGLMVCTVDADPESPMAGVCNKSTCECQSWNYQKTNETSPSGKVRLGAFWYCEVGPGWKPPPAAVAAELRERRAESRGVNRLGFVPPSAPCIGQWLPAPLKKTTGSGAASSTGATTVTVDFSRTAMKGRTPLAIRLGWPLGGVAHGSPSDTCCPTATRQKSPGLPIRGSCQPGNCPLYSGASELPANPFFAALVGGRCRCRAPQVCDA